MLGSFKAKSKLGDDILIVLAKNDTARKDNSFDINLQVLQNYGWLRIISLADVNKEKIVLEQLDKNEPLHQQNILSDVWLKICHDTEPDTKEDPLQQEWLEVCRDTKMNDDHQEHK